MRGPSAPLHAAFGAEAPQSSTWDVVAPVEEARGEDAAVVADRAHLGLRPGLERLVVPTFLRAPARAPARLRRVLRRHERGNPGRGRERQDLALLYLQRLVEGYVVELAR